MLYRYLNPQFEIIETKKEGSAFAKLFSSEKTEAYTDIELLEILDSYDLNKKPTVNAQVYGELKPC